MPIGEADVPHGRIRRTMPLAGFTARAAGGRLVAGEAARPGHEQQSETENDAKGPHGTRLLPLASRLPRVAPRARGDEKGQLLAPDPREPAGAAPVARPLWP